MRNETELLTPAEAAVVAGVPLRTVYKSMAERLPKGTIVRRNGRKLLTRTAAVCLRLDREIPRDVPAKVRRALFAAVDRPNDGAAACGTKTFRYSVDTGPASRAVDASMRAYRKARRLVVEDPDIQGGQATFRGTRIIVHDIAGLLAMGESIDELRDGYPSLTDAMIAAAPIYAKANPRRGRPLRPLPTRRLISERWYDFVRP